MSSKMFVILPLMFVSKYLDFEDPRILLGLRIAFVCCHLLQLLLAFYIKHAVKVANNTGVCSVPAAAVPSPFAPEPETPGVLTPTTYVEHETKKATEFMTQALMGAMITTTIHFYGGVNQVLLMQSIMIPMNLWDNVLVKALLMGRDESSRIWKETRPGDPPLDLTNGTQTTSKTSTSSSTLKSSPSPGVVPTKPKEALVAVWDAAEAGDFLALYDRLSSCPNVATEDGWTGLMVACGSPVNATVFLTKFLKLKPNLLATDVDGWTALHWAAFHGREVAATLLLAAASASQREALLTAKDTKGKSAQTIAEEEANVAVLAVLATTNGLEKKKAGSSDKSEGVRQRHTKTNDMSNVD